MDDGADDRIGHDEFTAADNAPAPARAVRRVRVLMGMVPLAEMTVSEVAAVFRDRVDTAG